MGFNPGDLAGEYKSIFTARYEAGSSVRHGTGTSFGVDNTSTQSVLHHFSNSILTSHVGTVVPDLLDLKRFYN